VGSWGTAIFSDDFAADIRGDWRDAIIDGADPDEVTRGLIDRLAQDEGDQTETTLFWLALAAAQMETGRLDSAVRDRALAIIGAGGDLARWRAEDESLARQREKVLTRLGDRLRGPQPAPKRLRRTALPGVAFDVGDAIRLRAGDRMTNVIAIVVSHQEGYPRGTVNPVVAFVVWEEDRQPTAAELGRLPCIVTEMRYLLPDWPSRIRPRLIVVTTPTKKQRFGSHIGEIVARDTPQVGLRRPITDQRFYPRSYTTWEGVTQIIAGNKFRSDIELTTRRR
jgi:hypothetical protein